MGLLYLFIGLCVTLALHAGLQKLSTASPHRIKKTLKWLVICLLLLAMLLLLRFGQPILAGLVALSGFAVALVSRILAIASLAAMFKNLRHTHSTAAPSSDKSAMSLAEARDILGVGPNASAADIKSAHHHKMKQHHPDQGGSDYFAKKLNEARDLLLRHCKG